MLIVSNYTIKYILHLTLLCILVFLMLSTSCAVYRPVDQDLKQLLENHLNSWKDYELNGIVEINYGHLRFRKNIVVKMNSDKFNMVIYDRGIFGLRPKPFISATIDSIMTIEGPDLVVDLIKEYDSFDINIGDIHDSILLLQNRYPQIIRNQHTKLTNTHFYFNDIMQIEELVISENHTTTISKTPLNNKTITITFEYDRNSIVNSISLYHGNDNLMHISIDRFN